MKQLGGGVSGRKDLKRKVFAVVVREREIFHAFYLQSFVLSSLIIIHMRILNQSLEHKHYYLITQTKFETFGVKFRLTNMLCGA